MHRADNLVAALELARLGFRVYPLRAMSSTVPAFDRWESSLATTRAQDVISWWTSDPAWNIATYLPSDVVRIDIDVRDGCDGYESSLRLEREHGEIPPTLTVGTPSGGLHSYLRLPSGAGRPPGDHAPSVHLAVGVELCWTRWAPLPPTIRKDGRYRWNTDREIPIAPLPAWVFRVAATCSDRAGDAALMEPGALAVLGLKDRPPALYRLRDGSYAQRWGSLRCPAHDDRHASAYALRFSDGGVLVGCSAGCSASDIRRALERAW